MVFAAARGNVALVTDAMAAAGMPDGTYQLGPQRVTVEDGIARIANGSIAGGTSHLIEVLQRAVRESAIPLVDAVRAASEIPAAVLGLDGTCGSIRPGRYADLSCRRRRPRTGQRHAAWQLAVVIPTIAR